MNNNNNLIFLGNFDANIRIIRKVTFKVTSYYGDKLFKHNRIKYGKKNNIE